MSRPLVRWVQPEGVRGTLAELLARLGASADGALLEGRVFVDGRRELAGECEVASGVVVEVHAARATSASVTVLAEHRGLVFVSKPPGVATEPDHAGVSASVVARVAELLSVPPSELHALSRLDVGVSGVVTLARTSEARELAAQLRARTGFARRYVALAPCAPEPAEGAWTWALPRDARRTGRSNDERAAETRYSSVARAALLRLPGRDAARLPTQPALLALAPITGRTHQLRLHAARAGVPLLGDRAHGGAQRLLLANGSVRGLERVCLHAAWVELALGTGRLRVASPVPEDLALLWRDLGGAADDWARALEIALPPAQR